MRPLIAGALGSYVGGWSHERSGEQFRAAFAASDHGVPYNLPIILRSLGQVESTARRAQGFSGRSVGR